METLTAQYYNALTAGASLDPNQFQLAQGSISLTPDSSAIWRFFDSMPPQVINNFFQTSQLNSFSQTYGAVINNLIPQSDNQAQVLLADSYVGWVEYQKNNPLTVSDWSVQAEITKATLAQFNQWAHSVGLDSSKISAMQTLLGQTDIIANAMNAYNAARAAGGLAYTASATNLTNSLQSGTPKSFTLESKTQSSKLDHKWAKAKVSAEYWFVSGSASSAWDRTITDMASKGIKMEVSFKKLATLVGGPYALSTQMSPELAKYVPWYNAKALQTARAQNDNNLWKHSAPTWEQTFGPDGNMQQATTALIVVDGVMSTLTSTASVAKSDQENFQAAARLGVWPWFQANASGGWQNVVKFNDDGTFSVTSGNPKEGNPVVLGALVTNIQNAFN
ncbi:MAG: hypothetical protein L0H73_05865 [Nitrococcus sp.]|nr:hypothetical protein [Nitrococcus sp.]